MLDTRKRRRRTAARSSKRHVEFHVDSHVVGVCRDFNVLMTTIAYPQAVSRL